ncbi:DUF3152 domain-containing protein [Streptomyces sp. CRN 30]|uniref:DUF3152 domain-containing protein n=1 Tax=Streptomyces sp. CRN 30 TaxID=3075613 RepID=UPI002A822004|nr:DUF3152 domain-containing protein [Streptomyces sp. CRN 30]
MGRHSRRGPAPKGDPADAAAARQRRSARPEERTTPGRGSPRSNEGNTRSYEGNARSNDGNPRAYDDKPSRGVPRLPDGTPAHGVRQVRGGHPEQREPGGGWGAFRESGPSGSAPGTQPHGPGATRAPGAAQSPGVPLPRQRRTPPGGPRQDYLDAFDGGRRAFDGRDAYDGSGDDGNVYAAHASTSPRNRSDAHAPTEDPYASVTDWTAETGAVHADGDSPDRADGKEKKGAKGRAFTGVAAAAVTTVLAIVVAGQVADGRDGAGTASGSATDQARATSEAASGAGEGTSESDTGTEAEKNGSAPLTYAQKMGTIYPLAADLKATGKFDAVPGIAKAPGKGQKYTYRVDVEKGLGLDGELFAQAVQKTLNDDRSWAHNGARTFERIHSGDPDFVITLASPGTTADWCAKSGLDTTVDNVSCDSAATERVMINAYRWAQGAKTYGDDKIYAYRQMLINHEVGHRLGYNHVTCDKNGDLAPVMQQQTKFLEYDGIRCRPNAWAYPSG